MFVNLNVKSHYSLLSSILSIKDIISFALNNNQKYVVLTDFNVLYGVVEFFDLAKKNNLIPIIGLEIFYEPSLSNLVLFAKNNNGYKNLIKISSFTMCKTKFNLDDYLDDIIVVIKSGNYLPKKNVEYFYANSKCNKGIAFNEVNCLNSDDSYLINILNAIKNDYVFQTLDEIHFNVKNNQFLTTIEANKIYSKKQLDNLQNLLSKINLNLDEFHTNLIKFPTPRNISSRLYLQTLCKEGLKKRFQNKNIIPNEYINHLKHELNVIDSMGFNDYFLIVYDFINWARKEGIIIGPGRGSVVGSLVAYSLFITDVNPLEFNLIFERFLNPDRKSLPDIDVDIMDTRRDEVIDYMFNKYGADHAAQIITFQKIKAKMAIRDAGRVLNIDLKEIDLISKLINSKYDENLDEAILNTEKLKQKVKEYPELFKIAKRLIGLPRQIGTHAAGIVLSDVVLTDIIPVQLGLNNRLTSQFSMEYLERFGLLKMDLLGLKNLTIIDNILKLIKANENKGISLLDIPLDDKKTFELFSSQKTNGIFQFESPGMKNVLKLMQPKTIEDLSLVSSLFRPGPQDNIKTFIKRRNNEEKTTYISNNLVPFLKDTHGIIVYQEQVIEIVKVVANFTLAQADIFRRAISKKDEKELIMLEQNFVESAIKNGYTKKIAMEIYQYILHFANYGFNHSHAVAYSLLGYWLGYFKVHYPTEFFVTLLEANVSDEKKVNIYIKEAIEKNIKFFNPDINYSKESFYLEGKKIFFGFNSIKGIGNETIKKIIKTRNNMPQNKFDLYVAAIRELHANKVNQKSLENLIYAGAFDNFGLNRKTMINNLSTLLSLSFFGKNVSNNEYEIKIFEMDQKDIQLYDEYQENVLGLTLKENQIKLLKNKFPSVQTLTLNEIQNFSSGFHKVLIKIINIKVFETKAKKIMAFINVQDDVMNDFKIIAWNPSYKKYENFLVKGNICLIQLRVDEKGFYLSKVLQLYDEKQQDFFEIN